MGRSDDGVLKLLRCDDRLPPGKMSTAIFGNAGATPHKLGGGPSTNTHSVKYSDDGGGCV